MPSDEARLGPHYAPAQGKAWSSRNAAPHTNADSVGTGSGAGRHIPEIHRQDRSPQTTREPGPKRICEEAEAGRAENSRSRQGWHLRVGVQLAALSLQHTPEHLETVVEVRSRMDAEAGAQGTIRRWCPIEDTLHPGVH